MSYSGSSDVITENAETGDNALNGASRIVTGCIYSLTGLQYGGLPILILIITLWIVVWSLTIWFLVMLGKRCSVELQNRKNQNQNNQNNQNN